MDKQPKQPEASWRFRCGCDRQLHTQITAREGRLLRTELDCMMQEADEFCAENEPTGQEWSQNGLRAPEDKLEVATEKIEVAIQSATIMSPGGTPPPAICWE